MKTTPAWPPVVVSVRAVRPAPLRAAAMSQRVDWARTRAFYSQEGGIRINLRGREPAGIVRDGAEADALRREIAERLRAARFGDGGLRLVADTYLAEEVYQGPYVDQAPDVIPLSDTSYEDVRRNTVVGSMSPLRRSFLVLNNPRSGSHDLFGILLATGSGVQGGPLQTHPTIADIAPTICQALGVPVPPTMDGTPIAAVVRAGG